MATTALIGATSPLPSELLAITLRACSVAKSAVNAAAEGLIGFDAASFDEVNECERELDRIDREVDERAPVLLADVDPGKARELLACVKFIIDLERVGDLVSSFAGRARAVGRHVGSEDIHDLAAMATMLERMLGEVSEALSARDLDRAIRVLRSDGEIDRLRNLIFIRHLESPATQSESIQVLLMAQALERAGDHTTNMAEEICHLVSGHTVRHVLRMHDKPVEQMYLDWLRYTEGRKS